MENENAPYSVHLGHDDALHLTKQGTTILLLDVPASTWFGIDLQMFAVGPNFKGVKMVPPGPHFVYYSSASRHGDDTSPVTGFFLYASSSQVFVRRWDVQEEKLVKLSDIDEEERFATAVKNFVFDSGLAPYDIHKCKPWQQLTNYITATLINRLEPVGSDISVTFEAQLVEKHLQTAAERRMMQQLSNTIKSAISTTPSTSTGRCFYTSMPRVIKQRGIDPLDLTSLNMDKSRLLEKMITQDYEGSEESLLGEIQFSFIAFLLGQSLESFSQWKALLSLMLCCEDAAFNTRSLLFIKFLRVVYHQLKNSLKPVSEEYDSSWFTQDTFFGLLFKDFFTSIKKLQPVNGELLDEATKVKNLLKSYLHWDWDLEAENEVIAEDDEYAPTLVDDIQAS